MTRQMTGAEMVVQALRDQGVDTVFGYPGGAVLPIYDALFQQNDIRHILVRHEQARGARRRGLRPLDRQARRRPRHLRPRRHQRRHRHDRRADGLDPDRRADRAGPDLHDRQRRLPGGRHRRHHPALHQAQLAGQGHREARRDHPPGVPRRDPRPPRPGARRHPEGRPVRHRGLRRRRRRRGSRTTSRAPRATRTRSSPRSRRWRRPSGRSSTRAAASSTPGREATPAAARARRRDRLPAHLDADGARRLSGERRGRGSACSACTAPTRPTGRCTTATSCSASAPASTTGSPAGSTPSRPGSLQGPHRHRPVVDQQEHPRPGADRRRRRRGARRHAGALAGARRRRPAPTRSAKWWKQIELWRGRNCLAYRNSDKAIKPQYALQRLEALTTRPRPLHRHRGRPAPDVGGAVHELRGAEPLDDLRRPRHHGLRLPGLDRRADRPPRRAGHQRRRRGELADEHAGDGHRGAVPPAGQAVHPQQRAPRHGPPVAGAPARRALLLLLVRGAARLRQARRGLRRQGHPGHRPGEARRRDHARCSSTPAR